MKNKLLYFSLVLMQFGFSNRGFAAINTATAGATWAGATWSLGHVPTALEDAVINSGINLTIGTAAVCGSLNVGNATNLITTLTLGAGGSLVISGTTGNLVINPSGVNRAFTIAIGARTLSVSGAVTFPATNTGTISISTGTATFANLITLAASDNFTITGTATINFNGGLNDGAGVFTAFAGCNINMGGSYSATGTAVVFNAGSNFIYTGNGTVTPTVAITFGNFQINSGVAVTLAGAVRVAGNWTNNGGTIAGAFSVTFSGLGKAIGGTATTNFSGTIIIGTGATYTLNNAYTYSCMGLRFNSSAAASSLTHQAVNNPTLTVTGNVLINNPSGSFTTAWNINAGSATVTGTFTIGSASGTGARIAKTVITTGTLDVKGAFLANGVVANALLDMSGGAGNFILGGNWTTTAGDFLGGTTSTVTFDGTGVQGVTCAAGEIFNTLNITNTAAAITFNNNIVVNTSLNISASGICNPVAAAIISGTGTLTGSGTANVTRTAVTADFNSQYTIAVKTLTNLTVDYNGAGVQTISSLTYNNLSLSTSGIKTAAGALIVNGDFLEQGSASFNGGTSLTHNLYGNWVSNTTSVTPFAFTTASTINFNIPSIPVATSISGSGATDIPFSAININNTSGFNANHNFSVAANLTIATNVTFTPGATNIISGAGAITGTGTAQVTRTAATADFNTQYTVLTKTLTNLTIDYSGAGAQTVNALNYSNLILSTSGVKSFSNGTNGISATLTISGTATTNAITNTSTVNYNGSGTQNVLALNYYNLTLSNASVKTIATGTTGVAKDFTVSGTATADATTNSTNINFNGSVAQAISTVSSTDFYDINVATGASASLSNAQRLIGTITLTGTGQFNTNNFLTLVSTATGTASIGALGTPASFVGNITMQRYVSGSQGYRYVGSAISGSTISDLTPEIQIDGFPGTTNPNYWCNAYNYYEGFTGAFSTGWSYPTNITNPMTTGTALAIYFYSINVPVTLDITGPPNTGNQILPVSYTSTPNLADGWCLVSNPYPSSIDWDAASGWTRTNIQGNTVYCWNDAAQNYASYPAGGPVGTNSGTRYIASSQGFFVQANALSPVLNVTENVKTLTNPTPQFWKLNTSTPSALLIKLSSDANAYKDESVIRFMNGASSMNDQLYDALKLPSTNSQAPYLATLSKDSAKLCVNSYSELIDTLTIPILVSAGVNGTYTLDVERITDFPASACLVLEDLLTQTFTDLKKNTSYSFTLNASSAPILRFLIHLSPPIINSIASAITCKGLNNGSIVISNGSNSAPSFSYSISDNLNTLIASAANVNSIDTIKNLKPGKYVITSSNSAVYCNNSSDTIIVTEPTEVIATIASTNIDCKGMDNGILNTSVNGGVGGYIYQWSNGSTAAQVLNLSANIYSLTVMDNNGCTSTATSTIAEGDYVKADFIMNTDTVYLAGMDTVQFTNTSIGYSSVAWDFGDSIYSFDTNTNHTYAAKGTYIIKLLATSNNGCQDSIQSVVYVLTSPLTGVSPLINGKSEIDFNNYYCDGTIFINAESTITDKINITIYNSLGQQMIAAEKFIGAEKNNFVFATETFARGVYFVTITTSKNQLVQKILILNNVK